MIDNGNDKYLYSAFISYRHVDPDQSVARKIQHCIETFAIPSVYQSAPGQKHFKRVFRDSDELSLDRDLADGIDYALEQSEFLIVILSHQYKESQWCLHEIDQFLRTHDRKNVLCVLAEGEPADVLPENITHIPSEEDPSVIEVKEPLCADYRLDNNTAERFELPRLLSAMLHCSYDDLVKRQDAYRRKMYIKIGLAAVTVAALIIILQASNLIKLNNAYQNTLYSQSKTLATQALRYLSDFDRKKALEYSIRSLSDEDGDASSDTPEALNAMARSTYVYQPSALTQIRSRSMQNDIVNYAVTPTLNRLVTLDSSAWILVQSDSGEQISYWQIDGTDNFNYGFILQDDHTVLAWRGQNLYSYDYEGYKRNWGTRVTENSDSLVNSNITSAKLVGDTACSAMTSYDITLLDLKDGHILKRLKNTEIVKQIQAETGGEEDTVFEGTDLILGNQYVDERGIVYFSGTLSTYSEDDTGFAFCIASWNTETGELKTRVCDLPPFCVAMSSPSAGNLVVVSAKTQFAYSSEKRLSSEIGSNEFSSVEILGFDSDTLQLKWEYATDSIQTVNIPDILCIPAGDQIKTPLAAVIFDVSAYLFDLESGKLYSSLTLPENIIMVDASSREAVVYYCNNQRAYYLLPDCNTVVEEPGLSPFPGNLQAAEKIGDKIAAISGHTIYWFETSGDSNYAHTFKQAFETSNLEFIDGGNGLLAIHTYDNLYILDIEKEKIVDTVKLDVSDSTGFILHWKFLGNLPNDSGVLILSRDFISGETCLYSYNSVNKEFRKLFIFSEKVEYATFWNWTNSFALSDGVVYMVSTKKEQTLVYYDTVKDVSGELPVRGLPSSAVLAQIYSDHVHEFSQKQADIVISPDGKYLFSALYDSSDGSSNSVIIDLENGNSTLLNQIPSNIVSFSDTGSTFAFGTDYTIRLYDKNFSEFKEIPISGFNVRSMFWHQNELWVEFSNNIVRHYSDSGELLSEIALDRQDFSMSSVAPKWSVVPVSDTKEAVMLVDEKEMNLLSTDPDASTPILHISNFIEWNNNDDTFLIVNSDSFDPISGIPYSILYEYKHYSNEELLEIGRKQLQQMRDETD